MRLKAGASNKNFVENIREIMHSFAKSGRIGTSHPTSKAKADKQAVAIAFRQKRKTIAGGGGAS
jgi:hypothetical protein